MTTTRFDKFTPRDYSMNWYVPKLVMPNFEAWDAALTKQQQNYDSVFALTQKNPKYLQTEEDRKIYQEYRDSANNAIDEISKAYQEQGVSAGNRLMRDRTRDILKDWQPGGRAAVLEDRYAAYAKAQEDIQKAYEKDARGINKQYATYQLQEQLKKGVNYNPETGEYTRIATPELYQDPNIQKLIMDAVKEIDKQGTTEILKKDAYWFEKIRTLQKPEDKLAAVTQAIYEQYPNQLAIETWDKKRYLPEEAAKEQYNKTIDAEIKRQEAIPSKAGEMNKDQLRALQSQLVEQGYDVKIDGVYGDETKKALNAYLKDTKNKLETKRSEFNYDNYVQGQVTQNYENFAKSFSIPDVDKTLIYNKAFIDQQKIANARAQTQALLGLTEALKPTPASDSMVLPDKAIDIKVLNEQYQKNKDLRGEAEKSLQKTLNNADGPFKGWKIENVSEAYKVWEELNKQNPNASDADLRRLFHQRLNANSPNYNFSEGQANNIFDTLRGDGAHSDIYQAMTNFASLDGMVKMMEDNQEALAEKYITTPEGKNSLEALSQLRRPGESDKQFATRIIQEGNLPSAPQGNLGPITASGNYSSPMAKRFLEKMQSDIKTQQKNGSVDYSGSLNTYAVHFGENDDYFKPSIEILNSAINEGSYYSFSSDGVAGLNFKTADGTEIANVADVKVTNGKIVQGSDMKAKYVAVGYYNNGKKKVPVQSVIDLEPGNPVREDVRKGLLGSLGEQVNSKNPTKSQGVVINLMALDDPTIFASAASEKNIGKSLTLNNTSSADNIIIKGNDGNFRPLSTYGSRVKKLSTTSFVDGQGNDRSYSTYGVLGKDGSISYVNTRTLLVDGKQVEGIIPGRQDNYFKDPLSAKVDLYESKYISEIPAARETTTIKNARVLNSAQQSALINSNLLTGDSLNDDE